MIYFFYFILFIRSVTEDIDCWYVDITDSRFAVPLAFSIAGSPANFGQTADALSALQRGGAAISPSRPREAAADFFLSSAQVRGNIVVLKR